jgi:hypothetical protein
MSTKNISYPTKLYFTSIINTVFANCYNQLPLYDVTYPFAVYSIEFIDKYPGNTMQLTVDLWDNDINQISFQQNIDKLINKLDYIMEANKDIHYNGRVTAARDIPTQEENLIRFQIIAEYNLYKVTI